MEARFGKLILERLDVLRAVLQKLFEEGHAECKLRLLILMLGLLVLGHGRRHELIGDVATRLAPLDPADFQLGDVNQAEGYGVGHLRQVALAYRQDALTLIFGMTADDEPGARVADDADGRVATIDRLAAGA